MTPFTAQPSKFSPRPFYLVLLIVTVLTVYSFLAGADNAQPSLLGRSLKEEEELECRRVHHAQDQCAFVKANCPDEDAGIFSYLNLYFCLLPHAKPVAFTIIASWLALLFTTIGIAASDFFCINLATIANILGMSDSLAGVTFLAFGNGSPDIFSTFAAFSTNSGSLAIGELIGAASFITAVVAGSIAFIRPFKVPRKSFVRDVSFFIIAASFSLVFLFDGKLQFWECAVLVGLYAFYVAFVLTWHWYFHRRMIRRRKEAAAREQFIMPGSEEAELGEEYRAEEEETEGTARGRPSPHRGPTLEDLAALERGAAEEGDEEEDEQREEVARAEISRNMRLSRPRVRSRALSHVPIRPSLVGALEFQAVMSDLQRSRNIHTMPIHLRRYSDDPRIVSDDQMSSQSEPRADALPALEETRNTGLSANSGKGPETRGRAVSANDADDLGMERGLFPHGVPKIDLLGPLPEDAVAEEARLSSSGAQDSLSRESPSPRISLSPPSSIHGLKASDSLPPGRRSASPNRLAPPDPFASPPPARIQPAVTMGISTQSQKLPKLLITRQTAERPVSAGSSPITSFPAYRDDPSSVSPLASRASSIRMPHASVSSDSHFPSEFRFEGVSERPLRWWPYAVLPPPRELFSALFPTVDNWREKNLLQKVVGIAMIPSVFLLKITLPIVETEREDEGDDDIPDVSLPGTVSSNDPRTLVRTSLPTPEPPTGSAEADLDGHQTATVYSKALGAPSPSAVAHSSPGYLRRQDDFAEAHSNGIVQSPEELPLATPDNSRKDWNRWLVILQLFTAPLFVVLIVWANSSAEGPSALVQPAMISLLVSLVALFIILLATTADRAPKWRVALCFAGFAVSITWISTIANEVVGVLKALGVILNISDAILGLTIFAVGNSCGDLVANITVGKLGFPNMALAACFGGPMLNILLGIGLSGMYLTVHGARERADRGKKFKIKPYHIEVSRTLLISGATLLVTLLALLVVVPLRRWKMDKYIGWALVVFWTISTVANVVVEVLGWGAKSSS